MKLRALDISEANSYIKRILTNDPILYNLRVKGEISNFKVHSSGNVYLSLKDEKSKLNCIIFKSNYDKSLNLDNGVKIIATGYISVYERDGAYQLYINEVEIEGIGNLYIEFNKLKEKLKNEGYMVILISASPEFYIKEFYAIKEVDLIIGTKFIFENGKFVRKMSGNNCKGEEKVKRLEKVLKEKNIKADFKNSYMFSDSLSDKPLLDLVGNPYLINYKKHNKFDILKWK